MVCSSRHSKAREIPHTNHLAIEIDLRQPSMLHGKKAFERVVWAFKNVLNRSVAWLFHDFEKLSDGESYLPYLNYTTAGIDCDADSIERPIAKHYPVTTLVSPQTRTNKAVLLPNLNPALSANSDDAFQDWALETYEWLSLLGIESPRILVGDSVDPFLCRYRLPCPQGDSREYFDSLDMVSVTWRGLLPAQWIRNLFMKAR